MVINTTVICYLKPILKPETPSECRCKSFNQRSYSALGPISCLMMQLQYCKLLANTLHHNLISSRQINQSRRGVLSYQYACITQADRGLSLILSIFVLLYRPIILECPGLGLGRSSRPQYRGHKLIAIARRVSSKRKGLFITGIAWGVSGRVAPKTVC